MALRFASGAVFPAGGVRRARQTHAMPKLLRQFDGLQPGLRAIRQLRRRQSFDDAPEEAAVRAIIADVRRRGDRAVVELERKFTGAAISAAKLRVTERELAAARVEVGAEFLAAIERIAARLREFHRRSLRKSWSFTRAGITLGQRLMPIERVGAYVPAGKAPLPSTLLMTVVPAQVAGVPRLVVCTPPNREGRADAHTLAVADLLGVTEVYKAGGAGAIAALAFGTKTIPAVDKIVGPGNVYVVLAKKLLFGQVGIESLPGPSEVAIIADASARPDWVAADLLAQAEHGPDSVCALLTDSASLAAAVQAALVAQIAALPRGAHAAAALKSLGLLVVVDSLDECCQLANALAAEHLQLMTGDPDALLPRIHHAGAIFLGHHSPVPLGDYVAGPSHVLPTGGTARFSSGLSVDDFLKKSSVIRYSPAATARALADLSLIAEAEGLDAHAAAVRARK